jgi:hypothetical protein
LCSHITVDNGYKNNKKQIQKPRNMVHRGGPGSIPGLVKWDLWWTKWRRGRFSPSTSDSPAIHSTKFSILTITQGRYNRPVSGRRGEWTQFGLHPPQCKLKKKKKKYGIKIDEKLRCDEKSVGAHLESVHHNQFSRLDFISFKLS